MGTEKKNNIFLLLSGFIFVQIFIEFILLKQNIGQYILYWINYFNLFFIGSMAIFIMMYLKSNYTSKNNETKINEIYHIIKSSSLQYYFQQLFHNSILSGIMMIILMIITGGIHSGIAFASGYIISSILGFIGVKIANYANIRMANTAILKKKNDTENIGLIAGLIMGILLLLPLMGILLCPFIFKNNLMFCFGASLAAILTRLTGGFFTKSADIAADMVGKLDYGLPEDDFRNPAVLADNIGDIVGDCIGSVQSFFAITCFFLRIIEGKYSILIFNWISFFVGIFILSTMMSFGLIFIKKSYKNIFSKSLSFVMINCGLIILLSLMCKSIFLFNLRTFFCGMLTVLVTGFTVFFFTAPLNYNIYNMNLPIKDLAENTQLGAGINVLKGMSLGKICTSVVLLELILISILNFWLTDFVWYNLEFALGVLSLSPLIMILDMFGPIADNSGGLVESVENKQVSHDARLITDNLDEFGNTTKAITKILNYILLLAVFIPCFLDKTITLNNLNIIACILGSVLIIIFTGISINIVLQITTKITYLVKNIFEENPQILTGEVKPDYQQLIGKLTNEVLSKAHWSFYITAVINIIFILIFFGMFKQSSTINIASFEITHMEVFDSFSPTAITILQMSMGITGIVWGMYMSVAGGAWDNCKKFIETGVYGGKKSTTYNNAVIGDLVGDIYKDTTGPAIAPLILVLYCLSETLYIFIQKILFV